MTGQSSTISDTKVEGLKFERSAKFNALISEFSSNRVRSSSSTSVNANKKVLKETLEIRSQMVDWMIIVCHKLKQSNHTFFLAIEIIDKVIEKFNFNLSSKDLHIIGVVALFIASKFEEIYPISMKTLLAKVCHNKYSQQDIISAELLILTKLNYKLPKTNYIDVLFQLVNACDNSKQNETYLKQVYSYSLSMTKAVFFDFALKEKINGAKLLTAIVYFAMLEVNNLNKSGVNKVSAKFGNVTEALGVSNRDLIKYGNVFKDRKLTLEKCKETYPYVSEYEFKI